MFNRASLSEQVEAALRQEITLGRLRPGQRISASDYLTSWKVSITPFRDAVRTLQNRGFVTVEPRKGVYVAAINLKTLQEIFDVEPLLGAAANPKTKDLRDWFRNECDGGHDADDKGCQ